MARNQRSLKTTVEFDGVALHSGEDVSVQVEPAPPGHGIVFRRSDLDDPEDVPALPDFLVRSGKRTVLRRGSSEVGMVEHLLAAAHGLCLDNLIVHVRGPELPGFDGSVAPYVEHLQKGGVAETRDPQPVLELEEPLHVRDGETELIALPPTGSGLRLRYLPEYPEGVDASPVLFDFENDDFVSDLAPARTFVRAEDVESLLAQGFGKGASADNTLVLGGPEVPEFRLPCEPTRHKLLDLFGDLSLLGADLHADVIAVRSGHSLNHEMVRELRSLLDSAQATGEDAPEGIYGIREIQRVIPHRYPFLLVDRVVELDGTRRAAGIKNVTINEHFFQGHWPDHPVMPGVLQLEAMAQLAGILLLRRLEHAGKIAVLASIDKVRFRGSVVPGDQLRIEVETLRSGRARAQVVGTTKVGRRLAAEATLSFALVDA